MFGIEGNGRLELTCNVFLKLLVDTRSGAGIPRRQHQTRHTRAILAIFATRDNVARHAQDSRRKHTCQRKSNTSFRQHRTAKKTPERCGQALCSRSATAGILLCTFHVRARCWSHDKRFWHSTFNLLILFFPVDDSEIGHRPSNALAV